jgi:hypothetical protein
MDEKKREMSGEEQVQAIIGGSVTAGGIGAMVGMGVGMGTLGGPGGMIVGAVTGLTIGMGVALGIPMALIAADVTKEMYKNYKNMVCQQLDDLGISKGKEAKSDVKG